MPKKIIKILFVLSTAVMLQGLLGSQTSAQTPFYCYNLSYCGSYSIWDTTCVPAPPLNAYDCLAIPFAFTSVCKVPAVDTRCVPAPPCNCGAGAPIDLSTGNTYIDEVDVKLQGLGGMTLERRWNSTWPSDAAGFQVGMFSLNWRSTFEEMVFIGSDHYIKYLRSDGTVYSATHNPGTGGYSFVAPENFPATLAGGSSYWTLSFNNGEKRLFDNITAKLLAIIDRNGNTTSLSYDSLNRLTTVTDPVSRHLYFSYGSGTSLVSTVTSDFGTSLSYSYDVAGRLTQVTEPDSTTISFDYNGSNLITSVLDSNGHTLESHTYDSVGRGLTSSQAGGVNAVSIAY